MTAISAPQVASEPAVTPLRRNRPFQLLWVGGVFSALGTEAAYVAYPLVILAITGSPAQAGLFGLVEMVTMTIGALPAGEIVDRFDQRAVLLVAEGLQLLAVTGVAVAVLAGWLGIPQLVLAAVVIGAGQVLGGTARLLVLRTVVPPGQLSTALAREEIRTSSADLTGPPLGGLLYGVAAALPFLLHAACMAVSWACAFAIRIPRAVAAGPPADGTALRQAVTGMTALWRERSLRGTVLVIVALNVATGPLLLIAVVTLSRQGTPSATIGLAVAGYAVGGLAGIPLIRPLLRWLPPGVLLLAVGAAEVPILWGLALPLGPYWTMAVLFVSMLPVPALRVALDILVLRRAPEQSRGRTVAAVNLALGAGVAAGIGTAGIALEHLGVVGALLILLGAHAAMIAYLSCDPQLRGMPWPAEPAAPPSNV